MAYSIFLFNKKRFRPVNTHVLYLEIVVGLKTNS